MHTYEIYIKSHSPGIDDFEDTTTAYTKQEAVDYFHSILSKYGWDKKDLDEYVDEEMSIEAQMDDDSGSVGHGSDYTSDGRPL